MTDIFVTTDRQACKQKNVSIVLYIKLLSRDVCKAGIRLQKQNRKKKQRKRTVHKYDIRSDCFPVETALILQIKNVLKHDQNSLRWYRS